MYNSEKAAKIYEQSKDWLESSVSVDEIEDLRTALRYHEWKYYVQSDPVLTDTEYDRLYNQLKSIESAHPDLITPDSPTQRVASDLNPEMDAVPHIVSMLSLDNAYNGEDLKKFDEQIRKLAGIPAEEDIQYCVEPKFDGGSVAMIYRDDLFDRGATRGNGQMGEVITTNLKTLPSIPLKVKFSDKSIQTAEIRGEAVIRRSTFDQVNEARAAQGKTLFANPRNAATGGLRMKNPNETRERGLEVFAFQLGYASDADDQNVLDQIDNHFDQLVLLKEMGFKVHNLDEVLCHNIDEVIGRVESWETNRDEYPYEIDGAVIKVNSTKVQDLCGTTGHHPRWAIAFKFKAKQVISTLLDVEYQVGKIGSITPVAKVEPVHVAGVTVSSISLHNEDFIKERDLRLGDKVLIERAGDVIPYIVKAVESVRTGEEQPIDFPKHCPINESAEVALVRAEGVAAWRCPSCTCGAQDLERVVFHVSKVAMNIDGFGRAYVERFFEIGQLKDIADVYNLDYSEIQGLEGFGERSVQRLQAAIEKAKKNPLSKLLHSLSIHHLGKKASQLIAQQAKSIFDLIEWDEEQYTSIKDIGPVVAQNVQAYFSQPEHIEMIKRMESYGVNILQTEEDRPVEVADDAPLKDKTILFTGSLQEMTRNEAKQMAIVAGAKPLSAVSANLDILVVGEKAGSKLKKAQAIETVTIWTEKEFLEHLNQSKDN